MTYQPVRKIGKSSSSIRGYFPSKKLDRSVQYESSLERDFIYLLEFDRSIIEYVEQPVTINYLQEDKAFTYTPDFYIRYDDNSPKRVPKLIEIKYAIDLIKYKDKLADKFEAGRLYAEKHNMEYEVVTEEFIRTPFLDNIKLLLPFRNIPTDKDIQNQLIRSLQNRPDQSIQELLDDHNAVSNYHQLWQMLATGVLSTNMKENIRNTSRLKVSNTIDYDDNI